MAEAKPAKEILVLSLSCTTAYTAAGTYLNAKNKHEKLKLEETCLGLMQSLYETSPENHAAILHGIKK